MFATYKYIRKQRAKKANNGVSVTPLKEGQTTQSQPESIAEEVEKPEKAAEAQITEAEKAEKRAANKYRWKVILCLWMPFFLSSLDLTIVATALPYIATHFDEFQQLNWAVTAYTLTSTAFIPLFGQLADTFGRYWSLQSAIISITIGSVLSAAAPVWSVFLLGRAIQGVGAAGIINVVLIILADKVSLKEQAINTSIFQFLSGISYSIGPVIGGYLTGSNWRYCFVLPSGVGALSILTVFLLRKELVSGTLDTANHTRLQSLLLGLKTIDLGGAALFISSVALIILATAWGGSSYPWSSAGVIAPLAIGVLLLLAFILYQFLLEPGRYLTKKLPTTTPMIPFAVLRNKDVSLVCVVTAATGAALYSVFYFIGIYFILVEGKPASDAGVQLLYYVPGLGVGVYSAIFFVNVWPRQTFFPLVTGTILETGGIAALAYAVKVQDQILVKVMMAIAGGGTGLRFMPSSLHLAGMIKEHLAPAFSMLRFCQPFGGTLALTIMGAVFQHKISSALAKSGSGFSLHNTASLDSINSLPSAEQMEIRSTGANATMWAFISILPILGISVLASFGLGNVRVQKKKLNPAKQVEAQVESVQGGRNEVYRGVYLLSAFGGRKA